MNENENKEELWVRPAAFRVHFTFFDGDEWVYLVIAETIEAALASAMAKVDDLGSGRHQIENARVEPLEGLVLIE